jgi:hypothetical protein
MAKAEYFELGQDQKGIVWDLLMYVPTVTGLGAGAAIFWHGDSQGLAYLLFFLACFFFYQAMHRILGRLMLLPSSPVGLEVSKQKVQLKLKNGDTIELVKDLRYFSDYAGKSFGLTGMDMTGAKRQYVFHKGQFGNAGMFEKVGGALKIFS